MRVYVGLGSNLGNPEQQIQSALLQLRLLAIDSSMQASPVYVTQPVGPREQPDFYNSVAGFDTELGAHDLLEQLWAIENVPQAAKTGRTMGAKNPGSGFAVVWR